MIKIKKQANLASHHSFGLNANASELVYLEESSQLNRSNLQQILDGRPYWILGEGTNTLFIEDLEAVVLKVCFKGIEVHTEDQSFLWVRAAAGESWDALVTFTLANGGFGLENLSWIPGTVGAAPIQNIGAYGVEVSEYIDSILCYDRGSHQYLTLPGEACGFGYRESHFKSCWRHRFLITEVIFRLPKRKEIHIEYPDLKNFFVNKDEQVTPEQVRAAVIEVRENKLPDPNQLANAGSFFKNPIVSADAFRNLKSVFPNIKGYPLETHQVKVAAGWLIDNLGFKGRSLGNFGCYEKQALILVNWKTYPESNNGPALMAYVKQIRDAVMATYSIALEVEPMLVDNPLISDISTSQ